MKQKLQFVCPSAPTSSCSSVSMFTPAHSPRHTVPFKHPRFPPPCLRNAIGSVPPSSWWWGPKEQTRKSELSWTPWWTRPLRSPAWRRMEDRPLRKRSRIRTIIDKHLIIEFPQRVDWRSRKKQPMFPQKCDISKKNEGGIGFKPRMKLG